MAIFWLFLLEIASDMPRYRPHLLATLPGCPGGSKELIWIPYSTQVFHEYLNFCIFMPKIGLISKKAFFSTAGVTLEIINNLTRFDLPKFPS